MILTVKRRWLTPLSTIGELSVDGRFFGYTLEDPIREHKIAGSTAIPAGEYPVEVTDSPKFKRPLPLLKNVANYEGVRIHSGNYPKDTEGCILVGLVRAKDAIYKSVQALEQLMALLKDAKDIKIVIGPEKVHNDQI